MATVFIHINNEHKFGYDTPVVPRVGEIVDIHTLLYGGEKIEGNFVVKSVVHQIFGYSADASEVSVFLEEASE